MNISKDNTVIKSEEECSNNSPWNLMQMTFSMFMDMNQDKQLRFIVGF